MTFLYHITANKCDNWPEHKECVEQLTDGSANAFLDYEEMIDKVPADCQLNATQLYVEGFFEFVHKEEVLRKLTDEGYNASTWSLLAEEASRNGKEMTLPERYKL